LTADVDADVLAEVDLEDNRQPKHPTDQPLETTKEVPPMVWNLKGRSIDDILSDLDALKNDPNMPMPIIEADLAPTSL
jgi:hypothetical protein